MSEETAVVQVNRLRWWAGLLHCLVAVVLCVAVIAGSSDAAMVGSSDAERWLLLAVRRSDDIVDSCVAFHCRASDG